MTPGETLLVLQEQDRAITALRQELEQWQRVAIWLASCHAATSFELSVLKSTPESRKTRLQNICLKAAEFLRNPQGVPAPAPRSIEVELDQAISRCRSAANIEELR